MSLSGRQQTLLSIYGSAADAAAQFKKPQRPLSSSAAATSSRCKRALRDVGAKEVAFSTSRSRPVPLLLLHSEGPDSQIKEVETLNNEGDSRELPVRSVATADPATKRVEGSGRRPFPPRVSKQRACGSSEEPRSAASTGNNNTLSSASAGENAVLSLYGDGFLEIPMSRSAEGPQQDGLHIVVPRMRQESGGFTLCMLLFKAADTEKHKTKVDYEGARHQNPELDDAGEFVRWLCCGSTHRSIFGCSAEAYSGSNTGRQHNSVTSFLPGSSESLPKLLAAKLPSETADANEVSFSIYDRGVSHSRNSREEDSGCWVCWRGWECWTNSYEVPSNRWVHLKVVFDCRFLQVFFDDELVDCARVQPLVVRGISKSESQRGRRPGANSSWASAPSSSNAVYIGGHPSYARSVRDWRARIGFVGLISSFQLWKISNDDSSSQIEASMQQEKSFSKRKTKTRHEKLLICLAIPEVGCVRDSSSFANTVNVHRNVFWRRQFPPMWKPQPPSLSSISTATTRERRSIVLLASFFDGSHHDTGLSHSKSMENLLLSALQTGDIRVRIDYALEFNVQIGHDHVCRTQAEYEQKSAALIRGVERMSPLLNVVVNDIESEAIPPRIGSFEISMELTRVANKAPVTIVLHSMATTGCFPNSEDIKKKIEAIILFEAKRSPGEEIYIQACRHLLAIADQTRHNRARTFMESVINRKLVLTERKVAAMFTKIGFFFALSELPEVVGYLKCIQESYSRTQSHRMDDLPSLSLLSPTSSGLYTLPFLNVLSISATLGTVPSSWRFICVLVDHDFQLIDFVHAACPVSEGRGVTYRQAQSTYGNVIDRVHLRLTTLSTRVFCIQLSLQKILEDGNGHNGEGDYLKEGQEPNRGPIVRVQLENVDERHVLGMFEARPTAKCRWFSLAAVYRAKKSNQWCLQALGGCGKAASIYCSLDEVSVLLAELHILQTYEVRVRFQTASSISKGEEATLETRECEEFAHQLAKNVRFGRNGRIVMLPKTKSEGCEAALRITLKLQTLESEVEVYTHENGSPQPLPSLQSICRALLRLLAQHGIKECLQQNPFAPQNKNTKRHVEIRVVSAQTNEPVEKAHVFIEKNVEFAHLSSNLGKTVLPTLTMGSRLMSIRRRLQKKRAAEITQETAVAFVAECLKKGTKLAVIASNRNVKLVAVIRARALLRGAMRRRREEIKAQIFEQVRKSEHAREYSRSEPMRLQRRFATSLVLSDSEQNLLKTSTGEELAALEEMLRATTTKPSLETTRLQEVERIQQGYLEKDLPKAIPAEEAGEFGMQTANATQSEVVTAPQEPVSASAPLVKERRHLLITDRDGRVSCRLVPGSYSLYVFHLDYFEWTSLVAVYPTITASGLYGGPSTSSVSVQELVVPLDVFRWTYSLQLVDYYQPHVPTKLAAIPLQITDDCSSVHQVVTTDSNGCAIWEVSKGLYAVDVLRECPCVLYSALKHVVVDGGRYCASRTITVPVLFGSVKVTVLVASAVATSSSMASVRFQNAEESEKSTYTSSGTEDEVAVGSSRAFQLELGTYRLNVGASTFSEVSLPVNITWETSKTQARDRNRFLVVLSPAFDEERTFRVVLSCVDGAESMDAILEVWNGDALVGHVWRQDANECSHHVELEAIHSLDGCEYQSLLLRCQEGFTYRCLVASNLRPHSMTRCLRPQVQIYSSAGLIYQCSQGDTPSAGDFYWRVCSWDTNGEFSIANSSLEAFPPDGEASIASLGI